MGFCLKCKKWINQPVGRKEKRFCNSTCRSNYWYDRNKKGKEKPESEIKYVKPTPESYDGAKLSKTIQDEPAMWAIPKQEEGLSFEKLKQTIKMPPLNPMAVMAKLFEEKREITCPEEYQLWTEKVENSGLNLKQIQILKTTNPSSL